MVGLLLQDCGEKTFHAPPQDENSKFFFHMWAICAMDSLLATGFVRPGVDFRNFVYNPVTLDMRIINIGPIPGAALTSKDNWVCFSRGILLYLWVPAFYDWIFMGIVQCSQGFIGTPIQCVSYLLIIQFLCALARKRDTMKKSKLNGSPQYLEVGAHLNL